MGDSNSVASLQTRKKPFCLVLSATAKNRVLRENCGPRLHQLLFNDGSFVDSLAKNRSNI